MAIGCGSCPQTFRTQSGREWHVQHHHADLPIQERSDQVKASELEARVQNEITAQISDLNSPLNIALDDRIAGLLAEVKIMIADSDRFLREHVEHWIEERLQAAAPMHQKVAKVKDERDPLAPYLRESKPARPVKVVEMACEYSTTPKSCSMPRGHQRSINLRYRTRPIKIATDEMVRDALEYCGIAVLGSSPPDVTFFK